MSSSRVFTLFFVLSVTLLSDTISSQSIQPNANLSRSDIFLSTWNIGDSRFDFIFSPSKPIDSTNGHKLFGSHVKSDQLKLCDSHPACLIKNSKFDKSFTKEDTSSKKSTFYRSPSNSTIVKINHSCNTHWYPPIHVTTSILATSKEEKHTIEWRSPYSCPNVATYEHPCHTFNSVGDLIDLTPLILTNGSYNVSAHPGFKLNNVTFNICNEAKGCGPNEAFCFNDSNSSVDAGSNDVIDIKPNDTSGDVHLTLWGQKDDSCQNGKRVRTEIRLKCLDSIHTKRVPMLKSHNKCENIIEWSTSYACPLKEISAPSRDCSLTVDALDLKLDLKALNKSNIPNIKIDGKEKVLALKLCSDSSSLQCQNRGSSQISACMIDGRSMEIFGQSPRSNFKFVDDQFYWETFTASQNCSKGVRVKFVCSDKDDETPIYRGEQDCVHIVDWPSKKFCLDSLPASMALNQTSQNATMENSSTNNTAKIPENNQYPNEQSHKHNSTGANRHNDTLNDTMNTMEPKPNSKDLVNQNKSKMNHLSKTLMICIILLSLTGFVFVLLYLDRRTQLRIPLGDLRRRARQRLSGSNPYGRLSQIQLNDPDL